MKPAPELLRPTMEELAGLPVEEKLENAIDDLEVYTAELNLIGRLSRWKRRRYRRREHELENAVKDLRLAIEGYSLVLKNRAQWNDRPSHD